MATPEGNRLAALRQLRGLSLDQCASAAGLSPATLEQIERGEGRATDIERLAGAFGLRSAGDEWVEPDDSSKFTVFLLHSATPSFDSADLTVFEEAMRAARVFTAESPNAEHTTLNRRRFRALPPSLPNPRDAAKQGHRLAREVREVLGNRDQPLGDIRELLESHFGIPVLVRGLRSPDLRAAAALDADRACAAVVLAEDDGSRLQNPRLTSVYLAHELCHVLFDPSRPGRVQIALDDRIRGHGSAGRNRQLEARAKGFAAELLLPDEGLAQLFEQRSPPATVGEAALRVRRALDRFQTPREIAIRHLQNLEYISHAQADGLLAQSDTVSWSDPTALPPAGALPLCFRAVPAASLTWASVELQARDTPAFVIAAHAIARKAGLAEIQQVLKQVEQMIAEDRKHAASERLVCYVDDLLFGDELEQARAVFEQIQVERIDPTVTTGLAAVTAREQGRIGAAWTNFCERLMRALHERWDYSEDRRKRIEARLRDAGRSPPS
jgi:transcriptional regulator with XRE-family HTH domain